MQRCDYAPGERWNVADHDVRSEPTQEARFLFSESGHEVLECRSAPDAFCGVDIQAVDLNHPGIAVQADQVAPVAKCVREQTERRARSYRHLRVRACPKESADDFDGARGVAETVPRDVKDDAI